MRFVSHELKVAGARAGSYTCDFSFGDETFELSVRAHAPVAFDSCTVIFEHEFADDARVLVNGYQSWTTTEECGISERMRDLSHVPPAIVSRFALDAMGDYQFTEYSTRAGCFHGFTYATFRENKEADEITLVGSLDESNGFTLINVDTNTGTVTLQTECPARELAAGESMTLCRCAVVSGELDAAFNRYFELAGITARSATPLCGYTSWYRHYGNINEKRLIGDMASTLAALDEIDTAGLERVFQIDDGWCKVGDWLRVEPRKFPHGLAPLARAAQSQGLVPGLWMAPFVCERKSRLARNHPDWLLKDEQGKPVKTGSHWSGGLALDTRHPDVRAYVQSCIQTAVQDWGFRLLKLDFLYAACMIVHSGLNRGELMADAMDLLRGAVGDSCAILACGVPLASAFGKVEYCRIGCDVGQDWDDKPHMRALHRERVSTKNSIANTQARSPLNTRAFLNDPDVCFLSGNVKLSEDQRATLLDAAARHAGMLLTSDDMSSWTPSELACYEQALAAIAERCRP